jgi:uncharacterized membrane protein YhaH (DUF805 family)
VVAYLACLPIPWLGTQRLHDVGKSGWHAWMPLIGFACITTVPDLTRPLLLRAVIWAQAHPEIVRDKHLGLAVLIAVWLGALLLAAGSLRTLFLWLQPGDKQGNRYGPAPEGAASPAPAAVAAPKGWLGGRLGRWPFLALLVANIALVYGAMYLLNTTVKPGPMLRSLASTLLYLPAFLAAMPRLHDRGQRGFLPPLVLLLGLVTPFIGHFLDHSQTNWMNMAVNVVTIYLLFQCWQPGDVDANRFGPPPGETAEPPDPAPRAVQPSPPRQAISRAPAAKPGFGRRGL